MIDWFFLFFCFVFGYLPIMQSGYVAYHFKAYFVELTLVILWNITVANFSALLWWMVTFVHLIFPFKNNLNMKMKIYFVYCLIVSTINHPEFMKCNSLLYTQPPSCSFPCNANYPFSPLTNFSISCLPLIVTADAFLTQNTFSSVGWHIK